MWRIPSNVLSNQLNPSAVVQQSIVNLANGAQVDFDFLIDYNPWLDMFLSSDVALVVRVFVRESATGTFRQLGADYAVALSANAQQPFTRLRVPGSEARVRVLNNSGGASTRLQAQVHSRRD